MVPTRVKIGVQSTLESDCKCVIDVRRKGLIDNMWHGDWEQGADHALELWNGLE